MDSSKTISEWEKERGILFRDRQKFPANKKLTDAEIDEAISDQTNHVGMLHDERVRFLKANGYPVTHENMLNSELSQKAPETEE